MRWALYHYIRGGWYEIRRYNTESEACMDLARWAWSGIRLCVRRVEG